jgi:hypothetical protein
MTYIPPPPVPRVLVHLAYAVLGAAMLAGLLAALWLAVHLVAAIMGGAP